MFYAWLRDRWVEVDPEALDDIRSCDFTVVERDSPPGTGEYEYKHDLFSDEHVLPEVERGLVLFEKYLAAF